MQAMQTRRLIRRLGIVLIVYGALVSAYLAIVYRLLEGSLARLFDGNLIPYAFASLSLMLAQGIALDLVTSFLINQLHLKHLEQESCR